MDRGWIPHLEAAGSPFPWPAFPALDGNPYEPTHPNSVRHRFTVAVAHRRDSPIILCPRLFDLFEKLADPLTRHRAHPDRPQSFVKLVEHQAHRVHQRVHVISFPIPALGRRLQGFLEELPVVHPVDGEFVGLHVGLVEHEDEGESSLVQDSKTRRTGKEHTVAREVFRVSLVLPNGPALAPVLTLRDKAATLFSFFSLFKEKTRRLTNKRTTCCS